MRELESFNEDDLRKLSALKLIFSKSEIPVKGDAIIMVASLVSWMNNLDVKIKDAIKKDGLLKLDKKKPKIKKLVNDGTL